MNPPKLRRRFSVRSRSTERDDRGERVATYQHKFSIWTEEPRDGSTQLSLVSGAARTQDTVRMRARFRTDVEVGDQLVDTRGAFIISSVTDVDGTGRWLQIVAQRAPAEGT